MEGHATLPDGDNLNGVRQVITRFIEQYLSQPPTENNTEYAVKKKVVELWYRPPAFRERRLRFDAPFAEIPRNWRKARRYMMPYQ